MIRGFLLRNKYLYRFSILTYYFSILGTYTFYFFTDDYGQYFQYLSNTIGGSLFACFVLMLDAIMYRKCVWLKSAIFGIASHSFINLLFIGNYNTGYFDGAQFFSFFAVTVYICIFILIEELKINKVEKYFHL